MMLWWACSTASWAGYRVLDVANKSNEHGLLISQCHIHTYTQQQVWYDELMVSASPNHAVFMKQKILAEWKDKHTIYWAISINSKEVVYRYL